jgi:Arc/MetJ-type ribon-helix-helix transcriptional regulator
MRVSISSPDLVQFVEAQVNQGRFDSADAVIEAAVALLRYTGDDEELTEETLAAIRKSEEQFDRGEGRDFREALLELRQKYEQK